MWGIEMIEPGLRHQYPGRVQRDARLQPEPLRRAAPRPILHLMHQAGGQRPAFDQGATADQRSGGHNWPDDDGYPRPRRRRAGASPGSPYPVDHRVKVLYALARHNQMPGCWQQAERQQTDRVRSKDRAEILEQRPVVDGALQLHVWSGQAAGNVKIALRTSRFGHRGISSGGDTSQARCQRAVTRDLGEWP